MQNLYIHFTYPWLLLLLIPAFLITLIPYFRLSRKYRRTRNRITSVVLRCIVMVLCITVLSGIQFVYEIPTDANEVIILVDVSDTQKDVKARRDKFVETVISDGQLDNFKIGVVTFGFDQVYAVPLTFDNASIYKAYEDAELPDTCATDIAAALNYTKDLFTNPKTAKIVLVTDGKETDESAANVIRSIAAQGTKVDTAYISDKAVKSDVQVIGVQLPDYHVNVGEECSVGVTLNSNVSCEISVDLYDNDVKHNANGSRTISVEAGKQTTVSFTHIFDELGLHQLAVKINEAEGTNNSVTQNDEYHSYTFLEKFNNLLVLEGFEGQSQYISDILTTDDNFKVTVKTLNGDAELPATIEELCEYDQVILNNVANSDLPEGFDNLLFQYVNDYGGGMFTVGGCELDGNGENIKDEKGNIVPHAYSRADMYGSVLQQMLPVQSIDYTPPVGVVFLLDTSGSMADTSGTPDGQTRLEWATNALSSLFNTGAEFLSERDKVGLITLDDQYTIVMPMTSRAESSKIISRINSVDTPNGGTKYAGSIERAARLLRTEKDVSVRHVVIVSDGLPNDPESDYLPLVEEYYKTNNITFSAILIGSGEGTREAEVLRNLVNAGGGLDKTESGQPRSRLFALSDIKDLSSALKTDLMAEEIKAVKYKKFKPYIENNFSSVVRGLERDEEGTNRYLNIELDGFFGTKARDGVDVVLIGMPGEYNVPIYAQWRVGKGSVGSFMSDLYGGWSKEFLEAGDGKKFLENVVNALLPAESVRPSSLNVSLKADNYINRLSVLTDLEDGESVSAQIIDIGSPDAEPLSLNTVTAAPVDGKLTDLPVFTTLALDSSNGYTRCDFVVRRSGIYKIVLQKLAANGDVIDTFETYKEFSYSKEYDLLTSDEITIAENNLQTLARRGNGSVIEDIEDPREVYEGFITALVNLFDPRIILISIAIVLVLLDVAVRKFKFKWPHEIIRSIREERGQNKK